MLIIRPSALAVRTSPHGRKVRKNLPPVIRQRFLIGVVLLVISTGCGTLPNGHGWGQDATLWPGVHQLGHAALEAAVDPVTWVPAAGATVFAVDHFDRRVSDWASTHTPIFHSQSSANNTSTILMDIACGGAVVTAVAAPSGPAAGDWMLNKLKGGGVEIAAGAAAGGVTSLLKQAVGRERPDGSSTTSFPSGHSTGAFACAALGGQNTRALVLPKSAELTVRGGFLVLATGTAWARVEAKRHYPSDVLAGAAIGNFVARFIYDTFLGADLRPPPVDLSVLPDRNGVIVNVAVGF
jgi:membrane-associated phospholipid phosphatase